MFLVIVTIWLVLYFDLAFSAISWNFLAGFYLYTLYNDDKTYADASTFCKKTFEPRSSRIAVLKEKTVVFEVIRSIIRN